MIKEELILRKPIQLLVGLGNPGPAYAETRHNAGNWAITMLAEHYGVSLRPEPKFHGVCGTLKLQDAECKLLLPITYMNLSGQAVRTIAAFYKIPVESILVAHDELDFPCGTLRLKLDGGHGGHNGLKDITQSLGSNNFWRLRIGIDHPGHKDLVSAYVLSKPSGAQREQILQALERVKEIVPQLLSGDFDGATRVLHGTGVTQ